MLLIFFFVFKFQSIDFFSLLISDETKLKQIKIRTFSYRTHPSGSIPFWNLVLFFCLSFSISLSFSFFCLIRILELILDWKKNGFIKKNFNRIRSLWILHIQIRVVRNDSNSLIESETDSKNSSSTIPSEILLQNDSQYRLVVVSIIYYVPFLGQSITKKIYDSTMIAKTVPRSQSPTPMTTVMPVSKRIEEKESISKRLRMKKKKKFPNKLIANKTIIENDHQRKKSFETFRTTKLTMKMFRKIRPRSKSILITVPRKLYRFRPESVRRSKYQMWIPPIEETMRNSTDTISVIVEKNPNKPIETIPIVLIDSKANETISNFSNSSTNKTMMVLEKIKPNNLNHNSNNNTTIDRFQIDPSWYLQQ